MTKLDDYQSALLAGHPGASDAAVVKALDTGGPKLATFIIDHGLGPLWYERTAREEFHASRLSAEALFLAQEDALREIDALLEDANIVYLVFKGVSDRLLLYKNPSRRACYDIDLLVSVKDRVRAASALVEAGFKAMLSADIIGHELVLSRGGVDIDLHWGLLRDGRLRGGCEGNMLDRRRRCNDIWMLSSEDALFVLLVHPAFAKHLAGWGMGLHRVLDIVTWLNTQSFDWQTVRARLKQNGVQTAAWTTLRWVELLARRNGFQPRSLTTLDQMMSEVSPGHLRRHWLDHWLKSDLSTRTARVHWPRLLAFSPFLHDTVGDSAGALAGRYRAHRRRRVDLEAFRSLTG